MMNTKRYNVTKYIVIWMLCLSLGMVISEYSVTTLPLHSATLYEDTNGSKALIENGNNNEFKRVTQTSYKLAPTEVNERTVMNFDRGRNDTKELALTFNGASGKRFAEETLKILREKQVVTTFFLTGRFIQRYPELVLEILEDGHEIGSHTFSHSHLTTYEKTFTHKTFPGVDKTFLQKELMDTSRVYKELTGRDLAPVWRAPYGEINSDLIQWGLEVGYTHVFWTIDGKENLDTLDWVSDKK